MPIPDFQTLMLPLLEFASDGLEHAVAEAREPLADRFGLSEEERAERLPSGQQRRFANRVAWAKVYLERAGLLSRPKRGWFCITARGESVLASPPARIDIAFLNQFPEFKSFRESKQPPTQPQSEETSAKTPEEALEEAYERIREDLAIELLDQIRGMSPQFFERLVLDLMLRMGYGGSSAMGLLTAPGADGGIDGVINEDQLGLDVIYLQAKKWENSVGRPEIQKFVGALHGQRARKGVFLTTSTFTDDARQYVQNIDPRVVLIDGAHLAQLMVDFNLGVSPSQSYDIKQIDSDYFSED